MNCEPRVPTMRSILSIDFPVALDVDVGLNCAQWDDVAELRSDAYDPRLEAADAIAAAAVAPDLIINVANHPYLELLRQKLRRAPVEVHINAALILSRWIDEVVGKSEHSRNLVPSLRIKVVVATAYIDRAVPYPDICETGRVVGSDRHIPKHVV